MNTTETATTEAKKIVKKYSYGAKPPSLNSELVFDQMRLAHKYRNALVELERSRRQRVEGALRGLFPGLMAVESSIAEAKAQLEEARGCVSKRNAQARKRTGTAEDRERIKCLRDRLRTLRAQRKEARAEAFASEAWKASQAEIDTWANTEGKRLREECGVYWGTYLTVEQSMQGCRSGAPPQFKRWTGDAKISVQLIHGLSCEAVMAGEDSRLRVVLGDDQRHATAWLRVGSETNRAPVWATIPMVLHRPLPTGGLVKWASLLRRRIGTHDHWQVQFDVDMGEQTESAAATLGVAGLDVGWRLVRGGDLRVGYWVGDDGVDGQIVIPKERIERQEHARRLQSYRDQHFDLMRKVLSDWLVGAAAAVPDWLREAALTLGQWKSEARLAAMVLKWRDGRFAADAEPVSTAAAVRKAMQLDERHYGQPEGMFDLLEAWRKKDKHLYDWLSHQQLSDRRWRDDCYRNAAAQLSRRYGTIRIEDTNWAALMRKPASEEDANPALREHQRLASVGRLLQLVREKVRCVEKVAAEFSTMRCHACGQDTCQVDRAALYHTCAHCGAGYDQDRNAALNLLASAEVVTNAPGALAAA